METPDFNHISKYPSVYEPSEDTFLFIDALEQELPFISSMKPKFIAEIGSGSGVNITALSRHFKTYNIATDINKEACAATIKTSELNKARIEVFNMNLLDCFRKNLFDVILFNPPYVETESSEISGGGIERSWAGGIKGREVMDKLFPKLSELLAENGVFYLVVEKVNDLEEIIDCMSVLNFNSKIVNQRKIRGEHLYVLKFQKYIIK